MNIIVSACLLGLKCRYDGKEVNNKDILKIKDDYYFIPVCPEQLGGLSTPRLPAEIKDGIVLTKNGIDVTRQYIKGAEETLKLAKLFDCNLAILKEKSPSCGYGKIYDGTFSGELVSGIGITADLLIKNGITVIGESEVDDLKRRI